MDLFSSILSISELATQVLGTVGGVLALVILIVVIVARQKKINAKGDYNPDAYAKNATEEVKKKGQKGGKKNGKVKDKSKNEKAASTAAGNKTAETSEGENANGNF